MIQMTSVPSISSTGSTTESKGPVTVRKASVTVQNVKGMEWENDKKHTKLYSHIIFEKRKQKIELIS